VSEQQNLLAEVRRLISERPIIVVSSKSDLLDPTEEVDGSRISAETGEGLEDLRGNLIEIIAADEILDPLTLPENWPRDDEPLGSVGESG
ncbi:MAG: hypothetical protein VX652_00320, partial [Candidatus Thermoplasmatota archaeon]|nr:hypothetical protein [Candidatus Thermoplasmatota archaeon]